MTGYINVLQVVLLRVLPLLNRQVDRQVLLLPHVLLRSLRHLLGRSNRFPVRLAGSSLAVVAGENETG